MARHGPLKKPSMAQMPTLVWMADHPTHRLVSASVLSHASYSWKLPSGSRVEDGPEVPKNLAVHRLLQSGWLRQVKKDGEKWSWYEHPFAITKEGIEVTEKYRTKYEEHAAKKEAEEKKNERFIIVRTNSPFGRNRNRTYGFLARVKRETEKRLYVERVVTEHDEKYVSYYETLHGRSGNQYVERDDVTMDNVTLDTFAALRRVESAHIAWLNDLKEQEDAEVKVIRDRYDDRRKQNQYAFEDEIREALDQVKRDVA